MILQPITALPEAGQTSWITCGQHCYLVEGKCAASPMQDIGVGYLLDLQIEGVEEAATCTQPAQHDN